MTGEARRASSLFSMCHPHYKSIVDKATRIDVPMRYQPFEKVNDLLIRACLH